MIDIEKLTERYRYISKDSPPPTSEELRSMFLHLWGESHDSPEYHKRRWQAFENMLDLEKRRATAELTDASMKARPGFDYIGVCTPAYCVADGKLAMNLRGPACQDEVGTWDVGGGKMDMFLPSFEENCLREVQEEYGCSGIIIRPLTVLNVIRVMGGARTHWVAAPFIVAVPRAEVRNNEPHKFERVEWFDFNTMIYDKLHEGTRQQIAADKHRLRDYII